jgi:gluconolactonase
MFFPTPKELTLRPFARLPDRLRNLRRSSWADANRAGAPIDSFLEGPCFDRAGRFLVTDIPNGRILLVGPGQAWEVLAEYDGWPNGLALGADDGLLIADYRHGLLSLDPARGSIAPLLETVGSEGFLGLNDVTLGPQGAIFFTDQGQTGLQDPRGRVYRLAADGRLDRLISNGPSPNGIVLDPQDKVMYVAMTRANCMWHCPLKGGGISKAGVFAVLPGIHGPDGLAMDEAGNLSAAHARPGIVWLFSPLGEPLARVQSRKPGNRMTNMAYGGADRKTLYVVDSYRGEVLTAPMPVAGKVLYSHL